MSKKLWILMVLSALLVVGMAAQASSVQFVKGRPLVPVSALRNHLGAKIAIGSKQGFSISIGVSKGARPHARIGDRYAQWKRHIIKINGVTYVPVETLYRFGYNVRCNDRKEMIIVHPRTQRRVVVKCEQNWQPGPSFKQGDRLPGRR